MISGYDDFPMFLVAKTQVIDLCMSKYICFLKRSILAFIFVFSN